MAVVKQSIDTLLSSDKKYKNNGKISFSIIFSAIRKDIFLVRISVRNNNKINIESTSIHFWLDFNAKMKIRKTISSNLDLNKCYSEHDPEQHLRGFSHQLDILRNANADGIVIFKPDNLQSTWINLIIVYYLIIVYIIVIIVYIGKLSR